MSLKQMLGRFFFVQKYNQRVFTKRNVEKMMFFIVLGDDTGPGGAGGRLANGRGGQVC